MTTKAEYREAAELASALLVTAINHLTKRPTARKRQDDVDEMQRFAQWFWRDELANPAPPFAQAQVERSHILLRRAESVTGEATK